MYLAWSCPELRTKSTAIGVERRAHEHRLPHCAPVACASGDGGRGARVVVGAAGDARTPGRRQRGGGAHLLHGGGGRQLVTHVRVEEDTHLAGQRGRTHHLGPGEAGAPRAPRAPHTHPQPWPPVAAQRGGGGGEAEEQEERVSRADVLEDGEEHEGRESTRPHAHAGGSGAAAAAARQPPQSRGGGRGVARRVAWRAAARRRGGRGRASLRRACRRAARLAGAFPVYLLLLQLLARLRAVRHRLGRR
eukprot:scaffold97832_cov65-Phaeocystis_antarctica.AAC.3